MATATATANSMAAQQRRRSGQSSDVVVKTLALTAVTVFLVVVWSSVLVYDRRVAYGWFAWHPTSMSLGVSAATFGIMMLQTSSSKSVGLLRHQLAMLLVALPSILLGTLAIYYKKEASSADHITTWHATVGITTVLFMLLQVLFGITLVWPKNSVFKGAAKAHSLREYHRLSGYTLITMLLLTAHLGGAWSSWSSNTTSSIVRTIAYVVAPLVILGSVSYKSSRKRKSSAAQQLH